MIRMKPDPAPLHPLGKLNRCLLACLLVSTTVLTVYLTILVRNANQNLVAMSDDLNQIANTAGQLSQDVSDIRAEVTELQEKVDQAIPDEKVLEAWKKADATATRLMDKFRKSPTVEENETTE